MFRVQGLRGEAQGAEVFDCGFGDLDCGLIKKPDFALCNSTNPKSEI